MRLWSLHPKYLDRLGLLAVWREGLLAQSVLIKGEYTINSIGYRVIGKHKTPYYNHPQLERFKNSDNPIGFIGQYLVQISKEAYYRGYKFKEEKYLDL